MADNTILNLGSGGDTIATDDIAGVKYQRVKIALGGDGAAVDAVAGAGAVGTNVQRVTLASDDPAVVALEILDNIVSGSEAQVDIVAALPAGTNNIGDVDVLSVVPGTGATNLGKAIDSAAGATDTGVAPLAIRDDSLSALTPAEGDWTPLRVNSTGALHVTGAGGGTQYNIDTAAGGTDTGTLALAVRDDALTTLTPVDGDYVPLRVTSTGALHVNVTGGGITGVTEDAASAGGEEGVLILGVRRDTAASSSGTDGDFSTLNLDSTGRLHVNVGNTVTVGSHAVTNAGTFAVQVDGNALNALQLIDNASLADDAAFTPGTTGVTMAGFTADEGSTDSVDEGDGGAARMTLDRKVIVTPYAHAAAGGATPYYNLDVDESEDEIKGTAGKLMALHVINLAATKRYVKFYNATAANVTVGTTAPVLSFPVPTLGDTNGAGFTFPIPDCGIQFTTAITVAATTGFADNDTGAPGANEVIVNLAYV